MSIGADPEALEAKHGDTATRLGFCIGCYLRPDLYQELEKRETPPRAYEVLGSVVMDSCDTPPINKGCPALRAYTEAPERSLPESEQPVVL